MSDDGRREQILVVLILILAVLAGIFVASLGSRCTSSFDGSTLTCRTWLLP